MGRPRTDEEARLGRNLATAYIAACHGIGLDYDRKKYADQPLGEYWVTLARQVIEDLSHGPVEPEGTLTIQ